MPTNRTLAAGDFNPRPPRGGATLYKCGNERYLLISIHAPREGGDIEDAAPDCGVLAFQSTPPARGATLARVTQPDVLVFQSTPPARGATPAIFRWSVPQIFQSTPPARGATTIRILDERCYGISIHAPREGGDLGAF